MTVREALAQAEGLLRAAGVAEPRLDAELLLRHVLGWDRAALFAHHAEALGEAAASRYDGLVRERASRRPLQHLTGRQWFWRHEFLVTPDVLVPRPETEVLVEAALALLRPLSRPRLVDVGTGSGCIALSLAAERPDAEVHATELSSAALAVARENARRLSLADRVRFQEGDLLEPVLELGPAFDLVASNPPYVGPDEAAALAAEVALHEPKLALFPPGDRYSVYRRLAPQARRALRPGGVLLLEIGHGMEAELARLCANAGFTVERVIVDLMGIPRTLIARG